MKEIGEAPPFSALIEPKESKHFPTWNGASLVDIIVELLVRLIRAKNDSFGKLTYQQRSIILNVSI